MEYLATLSPLALALALLLLALPIVPNLWAIKHAFYKDFPTFNEKLIWIAIAVFVPVLGGLAYLFYGRKRVLPPAGPSGRLG